eukprot:SAG11_NODE_33597_length_276_cov_0.875706_1_plen_22_part_10
MLLLLLLRDISSSQSLCNAMDC